MADRTYISDEDSGVERSVDAEAFQELRRESVGVAVHRRRRHGRRVRAEPVQDPAASAAMLPIAARAVIAVSSSSATH